MPLAAIASKHRPATSMIDPRYSVSFLNNLVPGIVADVRAGVPGGPRTFEVSCCAAGSGKALLAGTARCGEGQ